MKQETDKAWSERLKEMSIKELKIFLYLSYLCMAYFQSGSHLFGILSSYLVLVSIFLDIKI